MNRRYRIILSLIVIQAISLVVLWTSDSTSRIGEDVFALFMAVELVAFALMGEVYRMSIVGRALPRAWMVVGGLLMAVILLAALFVS